MTRIFVDADACPVKTEVYRVAKRFDLGVMLVANSPMRFPDDGNITLQVVSGRFDAADDWIAENVVAGDIVITGDIPLASRCLKKTAVVLGLKGREFTESNIGDALVTREILAHLRDSGDRRYGPPPFSKRDRSKFMERLDAMIRRLLLPRAKTEADDLGY